MTGDRTSAAWEPCESTAGTIRFGPDRVVRVANGDGNRQCDPCARRHRMTALGVISRRKGLYASWTRFRRVAPARASAVKRVRTRKSNFVTRRLIFHGR